MDTYEKKYKALVEAVKTLKETNPSDEGIQNWVNDNVPELKENEDERVRKEIIKLVKFYYGSSIALKHIVSKDEMLAWLEKQGEQILANSAKISKDEQKPADKVEPKFHEGDWVVYDHRAYQVVELPKEGYINLGLRGNGKIEFAPSAYCRLWTIQDAKDGDVLACDDKDKVFIYNGKLDLKGRVCAYCGIYKTYDELRFTECAIGNYFTDKEPYPATKEQRELLFSKMKEAGYEWDAEKKELKKIEQKQSFDIEIPYGAKDSELQKVSYHIPDGFHAEIKGNEVIIKKGEQNTAWSEEDERIKNNLLSELTNLSARKLIDKETKDKYVNWLKSISLRKLGSRVMSR